MAKMFPAVIPEHLRNDRGRRAEIKVYDLLEQQLSDRFSCYWSRPWHRFRPEGGEQDGEVDFVIAHPDLGILSIEVKGGGVLRGTNDQWQSRGAHDIVYNIKDPVEQARKSKYRLLELMKESREWRQRFLTMRHAVILPDSARPNRALGADAPLALFAFGNDLNQLGDWVTQRFEEGDRAGEGLGPDGMRALENILATRFELRPHLALTLSEDQRRIDTLTQEQSWILDSLEDNAQMAIPGAAGTGKTILALEKALRCTADGQRTLFVCFNNALASHLKRVAGDQAGLTLAGFHEFCGTMAQKAGIAIPEGPSRQVYDRLLPEALLKAVDQHPDWRFDAIIIDEGQDFRDDWLDVLRLCLRAPDDGLFYVFYDDNQRIYAADQRFIAALPKMNCRLSRNLRNTKAIHRVLTPWYDKRVTAAGPAGVAVEWHACKDRQQAHAKAATIATELIRSKQLRPDEIAILTAVKRDDCALFARDTIADARIARANDPKSDKALVGETIRRFKGLEAKCVILVDIEELTDPELIYVALSRPSVLLHVVGEKAHLVRIRGET